jgi:hypothetical protein
MFLYSLFCLVHSVQVKPRKKAKKDKPAQDPVVTEPELGTATPDSSTHRPPPEPAHAIPAPNSDSPAEETLDGSDNPEAPSPAKTTDPEVEILQTQFVEPARPTVLAKCSAKEELLERRKAKMDITDYTHLSIGEIVSGYINQVHSSRDLEIDMVKQIQQKSEVRLMLPYFQSYLLYQPPSLLLIS